ncbi:MAG: methionyl-tRNA formyltransferase [Chloroflexi bacterium]|nr:methionyl-tRNA formyltransferase [Chloroflexota bacterium]
MTDISATRIVFMGSPDFALPTLEALSDAYDVVGVVTQPDRPAGRGRQPQACAVKQMADLLSLPSYQPESLRSAEAAARLSAWKPDLIVVAAFGQILPKAVLSLPTKGVVNVHASLLPRWRGAAPIQAAIAAGDDRTGITIMQVDAGLDTGPILAQREVSIRSETQAGELSDQLAYLGAKTLLEVLPSYLSGMLAALPQKNEHATYAPKLNKADGKLDFEKSALELKRLVNAFNPWPGGWFEFEGRRVKVLEAHVHDTFRSEPEERFVVNGMPAVGTKEGLLVLDMLQPEGKKPMEGEAFLNGQPGWLE